MDEVQEAWSLLMGFKDGFFLETGPTEKLKECLNYWNILNKVYYDNYFELFNPYTLSDKWKIANRKESITAFLTHLKTSMEWPFLNLYNCYWGIFTLYDSYKAQDFPNFLNEKENDKWI